MLYSALFVVVVSAVSSSTSSAQESQKHPALEFTIVTPAPAFRAPCPAIVPKTPYSKSIEPGASKGKEQPLSVYSHGYPTDEEQYMLELINRARANPPAEGVRIATTTDPDILSEFAYWRGQDPYEPTSAKIRSDFAKYPSRPPLAFNSSLLAAARHHSNDMLVNNYEGHQESDSSWPWNRATRYGYGSTYVGENAYCYGKSMWEIDAGFLIDFGFPNDTVLGHRENVLNFQDTGAFYTEIGLGIIHGGTGLPDVGPIITTQDFGNNGQRFILGVVYTDKNKNGAYDMGEGDSGVTISLSSGAYSAVTSGSGGYAIPFNGSGSVTATATGTALGGSVKKTITFSGENVKVDFTPAVVAPGKVTLLLPANSATVPESDITFIWHTATQDPAAYRLEVSKAANFSTHVIDTTLSDTTATEPLSRFPTGITYNWRVQAKNEAGWGPVSNSPWTFKTPVLSVEREMSDAAPASSVSPNPTTGQAHIRFSLHSTEDVSLRLFNSIGEEVETMNLGKLSPNTYSIPWNGADKADGVYVYELRVGTHIEAGRIVLVR